jgi:hypothetical protein
MSVTRNCPSVPLSKKPLALVLIQVRYSLIAKIAEFILKFKIHSEKTGIPSRQIRKL